MLSGAAVPPWVGYNEEDTVQQQILALSAVRIITTIFVWCSQIVYTIVLSASVLLDRTEEIFCVIPLLVCSSTVTLSRCIQLPWWCWRKMSFFARCASTWSPKSESVLSCTSLHSSELIKNRMFVSTAEIDPFFSLICFRVKEEVFWRNYFYRVSLIKQSAQLTALAAKHSAVLPELKKTSENLEAVHQQG